MSLKHLNPFNTKDKKERELFLQTFSAEVRTYRRRPTFWLGLVTALLCSLVLIYRLDALGRFMMVMIVFGLASAHDTITSHFTKRLMETRRPSENDPAEPTEEEQDGSAGQP